jgi:hypothetical protein
MQALFPAEGDGEMNRLTIAPIDPLSIWMNVDFLIAKMSTEIHRYVLLTIRRD